MNKFIRNTLITGAAVSASLLSAGTAQAAQLAPGLFEIFNDLVNQEKLEVKESELDFKEVDPELLQVLGPDAVEVFFINEGAFFYNELSFTGSDGSSGVVFEEVTSTESILPEANGVLGL
ncbi:MAG: hypothetical protein ACPGVO_21545, partial [Spirulinaceae cyanobacterium]